MWRVLRVVLGWLDHGAVFRFYFVVCGSALIGDEGGRLGAFEGYCLNSMFGVQDDYIFVIVDIDGVK
jgi:hypothetical protein